MTKQVRKPRVVSKFNNMKPHPEQKVTLRPRIENVVRIFTMSDPMPMAVNHLHARDVFPPTTDVCIGKYHAGAQEFDIPGVVVSRCAMIGVKARDVVNVLLSMDMEGMPVVNVDSTQIVSDAYTHLAALYAAVNVVVNEPQIVAELNAAMAAEQEVYEQWL